MELTSFPIIKYEDNLRILKMNFPPQTFVNYDVESKIIRGILDFKVKKSLKTAYPESIEGSTIESMLNGLEEMVKTRYPTSDKDILISEDVLTEKQIKEKLRAMERPLPENHNCGDPYCPHIQRIGSLAMMLGSMETTKTTLNIDKWTPLEYPIVTITEDTYFYLPFFMSLAKNQTESNAMRTVCPFSIKNHERKNLRSFYDFTEAIYFEETTEIPECIILYSNGNLCVKIPCLGRRYIFIGMFPSSMYSVLEVEFVYQDFETPSPVVNFSVVGFIFTQGILDCIRDINVESTFYHDDKKIVSKARNGIQWWS